MTYLDYQVNELLKSSRNSHEDKINAITECITFDGKLPNDPIKRRSEIHREFYGIKESK
jgi:hypothetical protein